MKSFLLFVMLWAGIGWAGMSQNRSITFEPRVWKKAVAKAKQENKLIFLDCHTSWCGPCKHLSANIFTQNAVADFYNQHFVNVAMDMEKDVDGVMLSKVYRPEAFPTLLFIDPYTGLVVHRVTGAGDAQYILSIGAEALSSENTLAGSCKRYQKGDRSPEFVKKLMNDLKLAGVVDMHRQVCTEYFNGLKGQELMGEEDWELFKAHVDNPYSGVFEKVVDNRSAYEALYGEKEVAIGLQWIVILELGDIAASVTGANLTEAKARYQKLVGLLDRMEFRGVTALLTDAHFSKALLHDCGNAWRMIQTGYQYNLTGDEFYCIPNVGVYYPLASCIPAMGDRVILSELLGVMDRIRLRCSSMPYLARLALDRSLILKKAGDEEGAGMARTEYEQYCTMR